MEEQLVVQRSGDPKAAPRGGAACIHGLISGRAVGRADAVALEAQGQVWTYGRLDRAAAALGVKLQQLGVGSDQLVGVCLPRSPQMIAALLGVLKAGGAYLPLDPAYPKARLGQMIEDAGLRVLLTDGDLASVLPPCEARTVLLDDDAFAESTDQQPRDVAQPHHLAYAIFTSGSTGRPKAARLEHAGLCNMVAAQQREFGVTPQSRVLQFASLSFDASVSEIFVTLAAGATLCLADGRRLTPGPELLETLRRMRISLVTLPPSVLAMLGDADLPDLKTLVTAGEACSAELASQWSVGRQLINAYGPTETTVCATLYHCPQGPQPAPPIGRALTGYDVHVLDRDLRPVDDGEPGELCIGGVGVARDYLNRPDLTAERFVTSPHLPDSRRLYRTGDRVRVREDGNLEFLGRLDYQVKIRGVRIELPEIEAALGRQPGVRQAVVLAEEDATGDKRLAAFVVADGEATSPKALRERLQRELPAAMLPGQIIPLEHMPRTPNGKADRAALAKLLAERDGEPEQEFLAPRDPLELQIASVCEELLGAGAIGVHDDFFARGGDSLKAMDLIARLDRRFGYDVAMHELVHGPTVEQLAATIRNQHQRGPWSPLVALQPKGTRPPFFCVHPGGGNVLCYRSLALHLGADQPFYALQAPGVDGRREPLPTVEAMADLYLEAIREVQPQGPYRIGGWSFGGAVAYEMACRLQAQGEQVALLAVIDAGLLYLFGVLRAVFPNDAMDLRRMPEDEQVALFQERTAVAQLIPPGAGKKQGSRFYWVFIANTDAMLEYRPSEYRGKLTLFTGREPFVRAKRRAAEEWAELCDDVEEHLVPGHHLSLVQEPHVAGLAERLQQCLDRVAVRGKGTE